MTQWVITGHSHKMDGLLIFTEASSEEEAFKAASKKLNFNYFKIELCDRNKVVHAYTNDNETTREEIIEDLEFGEHRWWWSLEIQEVTLNTNLKYAVQW